MKKFLSIFVTSLILGGCCSFNSAYAMNGGYQCKSYSECSAAALAIRAQAKSSCTYQQPHVMDTLNASAHPELSQLHKCGGGGSTVPHPYHGQNDAFSRMQKDVSLAARRMGVRSQSDIDAMYEASLQGTCWIPHK